MNDDQTDDFFTVGTYASPRYFIPEDSPAHAEACKIFQKIKWAKPPKRADAIKNRFNAFSSILWAVTKDENWAFYTDLNKSSYAVMKWPHQSKLGWCLTSSVRSGTSWLIRTHIENETTS